MLAELIIDSKLGNIHCPTHLGASLHCAQEGTRLEHDSVEGPAIVQLLFKLVLVSNYHVRSLKSLRFTFVSQGWVIEDKTGSEPLHPIGLVHSLSMTHDRDYTILMWRLLFEEGNRRRFCSRRTASFRQGYHIRDYK